MLKSIILNGIVRVDVVNGRFRIQRKNKYAFQWDDLSVRRGEDSVPFALSPMPDCSAPLPLRSDSHIFLQIYANQIVGHIEPELIQRGPKVNVYSIPIMLNSLPQERTSDGRRALTASSPASHIVNQIFQYITHTQLPAPSKTQPLIIAAIIEGTESNVHHACTTAASKHCDTKADVVAAAAAATVKSKAHSPLSSLFPT
jgi:hypothetical protein